MLNMNVIDTNVLDAALRSPHGASRFILTELLKGNLPAAASTALLLEYEAILKRPSHLQAYRLTLQQVETILSAITNQLKPVHIYYRWRPVLADLNDDLVLEAAVNGGAKNIVTFNIQDFKKAAAFNVNILQPRDLVRRLKS